MLTFLKNLDCVLRTGCPISCCKKESCEKKEEKVLDESCELMTLNEIINGKGKEFPGLVPLLKAYLLSVEIDADTHCTICQYLNLISNRASGKCLTNAQWIRKQVIFRFKVLVAENEILSCIFYKTIILSFLF